MNNNQECQIEFPTINSHSVASSARFNGKKEAASLNSIIRKSINSGKKIFE
jgi:hypothetical protein